ncbi:c-type cytochrome [Pedobacter polaris]|uniref:C-type cytochrome n=1 Tax=Pedobacter polaris TaxID=2571273 RepID=A0A4U1CU86_9SPHI|nr:cbb3-type cytochrome c oxidase N-terminal domain-containing protein [Pedobacter polaris]TKC12394.1 c-type cytochrome [Pedobacter polaris]
MKKISLTFAILLINLQLFAIAKETALPASSRSIELNFADLLVIALLLFAVVALLATVVLLKSLKVMVKERMHPTPFVKYKAPASLEYIEWIELKKSKPNIWTKLLSLKPIEEEETLIIPHAYDGIHELNNPIPRWFNVLFYGTLVFAICYFYYYHVGDGLRQDQEYAAEIVKADQDKRVFLAKAGEKFDENSVKPDQTLVANGKAIFMANCVACHGEHGEGLVGPNLVDEFWLHGGSISDVFKTVKYGVPAKGMASWEKNLSSKNLAEVVNFIMSLQGTTPANAKAPQGEKYEVKSEKDTVNNEIITKN